jgi:RNA polymerase sigma factor (sigma-70 family)
MPSSDVELLRDYSANCSEAAFAELVRRHLDFVYAAAKRQLGSSALAGDVAQSVFLDLARNARSLRRGASIIAWLHLVTRRTAVDLIRSESRRRAREQVAAEINATETPTDAWQHVAPLLDETLSNLDQSDQTALMLRFFENRPLREVGDALGISDDAAQKRIARALAQLRDHFVRRGVPVTIAGLLSALPLHAVETAPGTLSPMISSLVANHATAALALPDTCRFLVMTSTKKLITAAVLAATLGTAVYEGVELRRRRHDIDALRHQTEQLEADLRALREERERSDAEIALTRDELNRERAKSAKFAAADPAIEEALDKWLQGVVRLKRVLEKTPSSQIPELRYLTAKDWLDATKENSVESDLDCRSALSQLRAAAKGHFVADMYKALRRYLVANNNQQPSDPMQLLSYFATPIDAALLERYGTFSTENSPFRTSANWEIREKQSVDPYYDQIFHVLKNGTGVTGMSQFQREVNDAVDAFKKANNSFAPRTATQLLPYLTSSIDPGFIQRTLDNENH